MGSAASVPRRVIVEDIDGYVENGVSCDLLTSDTIQVVLAENPADELFKLNAQQAALVVKMVGERKCADLGVL